MDRITKIILVYFFALSSLGIVIFTCHIYSSRKNEKIMRQQTKQTTTKPAKKKEQKKKAVRRRQSQSETKIKKRPVLDPPKQPKFCCANTDVVMEATDIIEYFRSNEVLANNDLKGYVFRVKGKVDSIDHSEFLRETYDVCIVSNINSFMYVICRFEPTEKNKNIIMQIKPGDTVDIFGKCEGYLLHVFFENCEMCYVNGKSVRK